MGVLLCRKGCFIFEITRHPAAQPVDGKAVARYQRREFSMADGADPVAQQVQLIQV